MSLYHHHHGQLAPIREHPFQLEKEIQRLFESNLATLTGLQLVRTECSIKNRRIDTLAFDPESHAFVIIEYKRDRNISVIDQGFTYLSLMLENKADFLVEYHESLGQPLKREDVDWSQTRVLFVAPSFTENQKQATNFKDIAIELWVIKRYETEMISIEPIKKSASAVSVKPLMPQSSPLKSVTEEIKVYSAEDHLQGKPEATVELFETYKNAILNLADDIGIRPKKMEIGFTHNDRIFTDVTVWKSKLKLWINLKHGQLDDPKGIARDVSNIGHWGNGDYEVQVKDDALLEYVMSLIKQAIA